MQFGPRFSFQIRKHLNLLNCNTYNAKAVVFFTTISGLPFWHRKSINKSCFFKTTPPWTLFSHFMLIFLEKLTLENPSKSSGLQNGIQNPPSGAQVALYAPVRVHSPPPRPEACLEPTCVTEAAWIPHGFLLNDFLCIWGTSRPQF